MKLDAVMHSNTQVKQALQNFVVVSIDARAKEARNLNVEYIPLMVFYSPSGKEIHREVGFLPAEELVALLNKILEKAKKI